MQGPLETLIYRLTQPNAVEPAGNARPTGASFSELLSAPASALPIQSADELQPFQPGGPLPSAGNTLPPRLSLPAYPEPGAIRPDQEPLELPPTDALPSPAPAANRPFSRNVRSPTGTRQDLTAKPTDTLPDLSCHRPLRRD